MCRIFGYLGPGAGPDWLRHCAGRLRHGGPDEQHHVAGPEWGLGATRLAITDPAGGTQPYRPAGAGDAIRVVFNGEIYNHDELRAGLRRAGYRFADRCDGSILPALYHRYGAAFTDHLDGMYAIAVLDLRATPSLTLVTDGSGMKPLYYAAGPAGGVRFASELPPLLDLPDVDRSPWLGGLDAYLTTKTPFGERTMFEGIRVLPPAGTARCTATTALTVRRRAVTGPTGPLPDEHLAAAGDRLAGVLRRETHRLVSADTTPAAICSGGLDSSLITTLLAERVPELTAFHIGYAGRWPMDEFPYAQQVTRRAGVRLREVTLDPADLPELLPTVVEHLGQPNADPITVSTFALFRAVHQDGFKVALTGDAADEIFGGYDRFRAALNAGADWAPGYLRSLAACPQPLRDRLYSQDYRDHLRRAGTEHDRLAAAAGDDPLAFLAGVEVGDRLPAYHLRRVDHLSMASAVEVRLPFCQPAVVRLAAALPASLRVTATHGKRVLYAAATGLLPDAVLNRPKQPFTLPLTMMTRPGQPLLDYLRTVLDPAEVRLSGLLDARAVQALLRRHTARPTDTSALALWALAVFQLWQRRFVVSPRPVVAVPA